MLTLKTTNARLIFCSIRILKKKKKAQAEKENPSFEISAFPNNHNGCNGFNEFTRIRQIIFTCKKRTYRESTRSQWGYAQIALTCK